jgi:hypothetical protein
MEWLGGHHIEVLFAQVSKACSGEQATSNSISAPRSPGGSGPRGPRRGLRTGHPDRRPGYQAWDSGVERVEGTIAPGQTIKVVSKANPGRTFPVTEFSPGQRMTWNGGMPLGLFKGVRTFTLAPGTDGATRFTVREEYTGPSCPWSGAPCPTSAPRSASSPTA